MRSYSSCSDTHTGSGAISIEAAELQELFLWISSQGSSELLRKRLPDVQAELADVLIQCLNFADAAGIDVLRAIESKIDANEEKYPVDKARGSAAKYTDL